MGDTIISWTKKTMNSIDMLRDDMLGEQLGRHNAGVLRQEIAAMEEAIAGIVAAEQAAERRQRRDAWRQSATCSLLTASTVIAAAIGMIALLLSI